MMEHRWSQRYPTAFKVLVLHDGVPVGSCTTGNISLEGMFVDSAMIEFSMDEILEADFVLQERSDIMHFRLPVLVRHVSSHGAGFMFLNFNTALFRVLEQVLYGTDHMQYSVGMLRAIGENPGS